MKDLTKFLWGCVFALPTVLFFSYYPIIKLGSNNSMNFELSLPLIWLVLFDVVAFVAMIVLWRQNKVSINKSSVRRSSISKTAKKATLSPSDKWGINFPGISDRKIFLLSLFPLFATISIFWSMNPLRAILTAGIIWLLFFAVFALIFTLPLVEQPKNLRKIIIKAILVPSLVVCAFCWLQCFLDILGVGREQSLLCRGCVSDMFGFPHPSGFAIEPQFMGNLLLAPTLLAMYLVVFPQKKVCSRTFVWMSAIICSATLFITFSRGAIYAYLVALAIMFIFAVAQHKSHPTSPSHSLATRPKMKFHSQHHTQFLAANASRGPRILHLCLVPIVTFAFALMMQGIFTVLGPTSGTFIGGITKSLHHLSLGLVDLRPKTTEHSNSSQKSDHILAPDHASPSGQEPVSGQDVQVDQAPTDTSDSPLEHLAADAEEDLSAIFDGYVSESTDIRLGLNELALKTWANAPGHKPVYFGSDCGQPYSELCLSLTPVSILFGVGLGGAGTAMYTAFPDQIASPKEIVQNQTFSLLLELGAIGIFLAHLALVVAFLAPLLPWWFVDGRAGQRRPRNKYRGQGIIRRTISKLQENEFWSNPALPLLLSLVAAYIVTLNFFSGLPNALQIYLMPPLLFIIHRANQAKNS